MDSHGFHWIFIDLHGISCIFMFMDCHENLSAGGAFPPPARRPPVESMDSMKFHEIHEIPRKGCGRWGAGAGAGWRRARAGGRGDLEKPVKSSSGGTPPGGVNGAGRYQ